MVYPTPPPSSSNSRGLRKSKTHRTLQAKATRLRQSRKMPSPAELPSPLTPKNKSGYTGNIRETVRTRELYKYYQPDDSCSPFSNSGQIACSSLTPTSLPSAFCSDEAGNDELVSSSDPALASFTLLTAKLLSCKRSMISLLDRERQYIIAESTKSLSLVSPHTHDPDDGLWLGGCETISRSGGLCENTIALFPPDVTCEDGNMILQIEDLAEDPRFKDREYVKHWPTVRYYAGVPLRTRNGVSIGSLCVIDDKPRPGGLNEHEMMSLVRMGETVMAYLERARGERDMKRGRMMELGLSKFVAGSFLQGGAGLSERRRDGRLRYDDEMEERRKVEEMRLRKVEQARRKDQERINRERQAADKLKEAEKLKQANEKERKTKQNETDELKGLGIINATGEPSAIQFGFKIEDDSSFSIDPQNESRAELENENSFQSEFNSPAPLPSLFATLYKGDSNSKKDSLESPINLPTPVIQPLDLSREPSESSHSITTTALSFKTSNCSLSTSASSAPSKSPPKSALFSTLFCDTAAVSPQPSTPGSTSPLTSCAPQIPSPANNDIEASFRSTFARASVLIREAIEVDGVVFLDGDLEGYYDVDDLWAECAPTHVSSDATTEATKRAERPKHYRRRSGILGYATLTGSSCSDSTYDGRSSSRCGSDTDLVNPGFDVGELDEEFLQNLVDCWPSGRIFSYSNEPPSRPRSRDTTACSSPSPCSDDECEGVSLSGSERGTTFKLKKKEVDVLKRFLPGSKSVVFVPLYDYIGNVFAVGFAWTCSKIRVFCGDVELSYMAAFGNSIMAEVSRLHTISADKAKGDFISSVSHELRSPLHGILASAEFLSETNLDSFQRSFVDTVESCGRTLLDTINHVLDFSKLNSLGKEWGGDGESFGSTRKLKGPKRRRSKVSSGIVSGLSSVITPAPSEFCPEAQDELVEGKSGDIISSPSSSIINLVAETDLSAIAEEVTEGVFAGYEFKGISTPGITESVSNTGAESTQLIGKKGDITVIIDIDRRAEGWKFLTQPGAIRRILLNLGGNAIKYTSSGWVRIRLKAENLPEEDSKRCCDGENPAPDMRKALVTLIVTDSGKGISREFLKTKLFTPFSQENPLVNGTGLGMSIVRQIVGMMGGKIDVKSQVGKGTEVKVSLVLKQRVNSNVGEFNPNEQFPDCLKDFEIKELRKRTQGMRVCLSGFGSCSSADGPSQVRAQNFLRASLERYTTQWFGMTVVTEPWNHLDKSKVDFVITNESQPIKNYLTKNYGRGRPGKEGGVPLIVLCSNAARYEMYLPQMKGDGLLGIVDFASKPCGPRKLAKALAYCLDHLEVVSANTPIQNVVPPGIQSVIENRKSLILRSTTHVPLPLVEGSITTTKTMNLPPANETLTKSNSNKSQAQNAFTETATAVTAQSNPEPVNEPKNPVLHPSLGSRRTSSNVERSPIIIQPTINSPITNRDGRILPKTLIVEDNPVNLMLLATFLTKRGYPFEKAVNGLEALKAVENRKEGFDVILMDLQMPIMSGIESTRAIRKLERERKVASKSLIIALTGLAATTDQQEAFEGGIDLFMVKPVSFKQLEKTLIELEDKKPKGAK
ncbi:hypothetical protein RUND412_001812 [Rhizina undulata]